MSLPLKIILQSGKDDAVRRYHPWIFSGAIKNKEGSAFDGAHAEVFSNKGEYLGCGIYQDAVIAVRLLAFAPERYATLDQPFWNEKIRLAYELRQRAGLTGRTDTNVYRLVHGEGDHLPGLIIDHYNGNLVVQVHATGMYHHIQNIAEALQNLYGNQLKSIYDKSRSTLPDTFWTTNSPAGFITGDAETIEVQEYGKMFLVDIKDGQKTGFFIDQRENRQLLTQYSKGKNILNTFCYSGGFSVYALSAGASEVVSVDSSSSAMALTTRNIEINFGPDARHRAITADAMDYIRQTTDGYDVIILDPPAFAKHVKARHNAIQGYKRLNQAAMEKIKPGGILFTFSCSQVVDLPLFRSTVMAAAILAGRKARLLHQLTQPPDHPVNIFHPEGQYLKGLVVYMD